MQHGCLPKVGPQLCLRAWQTSQTRVFLDAVTQRLEGLDLIFCPQDRVVKVDVPVRLINDDLAPGVKKGGWMSMLKWVGAAGSL
jgi:hypothetical protein